MLRAASDHIALHKVGVRFQRLERSEAVERLERLELASVLSCMLPAIYAGPTHDPGDKNLTPVAYVRG